MDAPITIGDVVIASAIYYVAPFIICVVLMALIGLANIGERWKSRKPDWKNDWEEWDD